MKNGRIDGAGTFYIGAKYGSGGYDSLGIPPGYENVSMKRNASIGSFSAGPITVVIPPNPSGPGFTIEGVTDGFGLQGPGKLVRSDGFTLEGQFDYSEMPVGWSDSDGYVHWDSYKMLSSYAHGVVKVKWRDGSTFEGEALDFFPFNRSSWSFTCRPSEFYGNGLLRRPGKKDYVGLVTEFGGVQPVSKEDFLTNIRLNGDCPSEVLAKQSEVNNRQAAYDAEMEEGRQRASAVLAADMGALSNKIAYDMSRVESASRGSSLEIDQENERKAQRLREIRAESHGSSNPVPMLKSESRPEKTPGPTAGAAPPDLTKPLAANGRKTYPFTKSVTFQSTYANLTKEKALETVRAERTKLEPMYMADASTFQVASESAPECAIRDDIRETGHWRCTITVQYKGQSYLNPDAPDAIGNVQSR